MTYLTDPRVPAILDRIRNNPPAQHLVEAASLGPVRDRKSYTVYSSDDVHALRKIDTEHFLTAEIAGGLEGARAYCAAAPSVERVVERVLAGAL